MDHRELIRSIQNFSLDDGQRGNQGYERVLLQLFGYTGHGKSSFINSCKYVLNDGEQFRQYAKSGQNKNGSSMTMERKAYDLTSNITIVDNRGCTAMKNFERAEVYAQLGDFCPLNEPVVWKEDFNGLMSVLEENEMKPNTKHFLVPMFVYSAKTKLQEQELNDVKTFFNNCVKMTGVFPIIIITNKTSGDYVDAEKKFLGMGAEQVISIENYTKENQIKTLGKTTNILMIIDWALKNVTYRLEQPRDPTKDRIERKRFLLNYIHEASLEYEKEKKEKEESMRREEERRNRSWIQRLIRSIRNLFGDPTF